MRRLVSIINSGHWILTHQGIAFNGTGKLLDGQHRLEAIKRAGVPVKCHVTTGLSDHAFAAIDVGKVRTPGDHFSILGYKDSHNLAAALKLLYCYEQFDGDMSKRTTPETAPDKQDLEDVLARHPGLLDVPSPSRSTARLMSRSMWLFMDYVLTQHDAEIGRLFMDSLASGANLSEDSLILHLRTKLFALSDAVQAKRRPSPAANVERLALTIKIFKKALAGHDTGKAASVYWSPIKSGFPRL